MFSAIKSFAKRNRVLFILLIVAVSTIQILKIAIQIFAQYLRG